MTFRVEGGYLSLPRWGKKIRRGEIFVHPVGIYPAEQLKKMTAEEVNAVIERDIHENAWERQRQKPVRYRGKRRAEGMERALFACPGCRRIGTLRTAEDRVFCDCGFSRRYSETGFFASETPFASIAEWDRWQMQLLRDRSFLHEGNLLFSDRDMILTRILSDHTEEQLATGTLYQYEDRLVCEGQSFALAEISSMAIVQTHLLLLSCGGEYYQLRTKTAANLRKYLEVWKEK